MQPAILLKELLGSKDPLDLDIIDEFLDVLEREYTLIEKISLNEANNFISLGKQVSLKIYVKLIIVFINHDDFFDAKIDEKFVMNILNLAISESIKPKDLATLFEVYLSIGGDKLELANLINSMNEEIVSLVINKLNNYDDFLSFLFLPVSDTFKRKIRVKVRADLFLHLLCIINRKFSENIDISPIQRKYFYFEGALQDWSILKDDSASRYYKHGIITLEEKNHLESFGKKLYKVIKKIGKYPSVETIYEEREFLEACELLKIEMLNNVDFLDIFHVLPEKMTQ
ncbi:hypothetical protein [Zooshikella ganghwensis]|uniref:Uncharacterized protein n=1 Tax=Zooshikella ganghwensis TaxID=202772 RepID=A0A4P9VRG0_9GAMM|nr:hypothetical protein [Zooshikella ganghwensis]RDH44722.1 hypothetical protein B9G39_15480 [Zooshikella ganghwensis]